MLSIQIHLYRPTDRADFYIKSIMYNLLFNKDYQYYLSLLKYLCNVALKYFIV